MTQQTNSKLTRRSFIGATGAGAAALVLAGPALGQRASSPPSLDVPYVPTPQEVVDRMLQLVQPTAEDFVMDLGCGDGRMLVTAASKFGARGFGVDLNPVRIEEATANAKNANVTDKIRFEVKNLFQTSIKDATVLTMYLLPSVNIQLRPRILDEMRPGSRIVSHAFHMGDWMPDIQADAIGRTIYHWVVPAKVGGKWTFEDGELKLALELDQKYQQFTGRGTQGPLQHRVQGALRGNDVTMSIHTPTGLKTYHGKVEGGSIVPAAGGAWRATRG